MYVVLWSQIIPSCICLALVIGLLQVGQAQVMSSGSYQIQSDSINMGGGLSTSTNFRAESTIGEVATGDSESETYALRAGYQQLQEVFISITGATTVDLSPSIGGVTGGESNGSTTVTVVTDSPSGYSLSVASVSSPAMSSGANVIDDYVPVASADYSFLFGVDDAVFGFSPNGVDVVQLFQNDGLNCDVSGATSPQVCWNGLVATGTEVARSTDSNHPVGATTTLHFRVGVGSAALPAPGMYVATTTVTAVSL